MTAPTISVPSTKWTHPKHLAKDGVTSHDRRVWRIIEREEKGMGCILGAPNIAVRMKSTKNKVEKSIASLQKARLLRVRHSLVFGKIYAVVRPSFSDVTNRV